MFDAAGHPVPGRHLGLGQARRGRQAADHGRRTATATTDQWGFYTETTDMENYWSSLVWQNGGDIIAADGKTRRSLGTDRGRRRHPVPPGPDLEGQGHARPGALRRDRRRLRAGPGGDGGERLVARADPPGGRASTSGSRRCPKGPAGQATSVNPTGAVVYKGTKAPDAAWEFVKYLASPAAQEQAHGAQGVAAGQQGGPGRAVRDVVRRAPRSSPTRSPTPTSSRRSRATTSSPRSLQDELDANVFNEPEQDGRAGARRRRCPQLDEILAGQ